MKTSKNQNEVRSLAAWVVMAVMFVALLSAIQLSQTSQDQRNYAREEEFVETVVEDLPVEELEEGVVLPQAGGPESEMEE